MRPAEEDGDATDVVLLGGDADGFQETADVGLDAEVDTRSVVVDVDDSTDGAKRHREEYRRVRVCQFQHWLLD
ncbi:unnamed protein product [Phytophthora lilii]|uniref:Unnamed protein product n=1 Tax=Phytophthora lilii TaxID=2077276 RepID=A0A9W6TGR3_9STRA|nr:unnamed protein product [Phytophthora lilii]